MGMILRGNPSQLHTISAGRGRASSRAKSAEPRSANRSIRRIAASRTTCSKRSFTRLGLERGVEHGADAVVGGRIDARQVAGRLEQLGPVVEIVAEGSTTR